MYQVKYAPSMGICGSMLAAAWLLASIAASAVSSPDSADLSGMQATGGPAPPVWTSQAMGTTAILFRVEIGGFNAESTPHGRVFTCRGQSRTVRPGEPSLPALAESFAGAPRTTARIVLEPVAWNAVTNVDVAPVETRVMGDVTTNAPAFRLERIRSDAVYKADEFWPRNTADVTEAWAGTQKVVRVELHPIRFNPVRRIIQYAKVFEGRIVFEADWKADSGRQSGR